jgi:hypothetical protein
MTTEEIVKRLVALVAEGKNLQAEEELYAQDVISVEQNGYTVQGLEAVMAKTKSAHEGMEEFYGGGITKSYVGSDSFLLYFELDLKPKGGERTTMTEYGFYKVKDGKVSEEYFFVQPLS